MLYWFMNNCSFLVFSDSYLSNSSSLCLFDILSLANASSKTTICEPFYNISTRIRLISSSLPAPFSLNCRISAFLSASSPRSRSISLSLAAVSYCLYLISLSAFCSWACSYARLSSMTLILPWA
jgi:hypothetical protein